MHLTWHVRFWHKEAYLRDHALQFRWLHYLQWHDCGGLSVHASDEFRVFKWLCRYWSVQDVCTCRSIEKLIVEEVRCNRNSMEKKGLVPELEQRSFTLRSEKENVLSIDLQNGLPVLWNHL